MVSLNVIGKKWSDDILNALNSEQKGFNQLLKNISGTDNKISTRTLADRLKELEEEGLISREIIVGRPPTTAYRLTEKGKKAVELLNKLTKL